MGSSDATFAEASCGDNGRARLPRVQYLWLSSHLSQERLRLGVRFIFMPWSGWLLGVLVFLSVASSCDIGQWPT